MSIAQLTRCEPGDELLLTCVASTQPKSCEKCAWCGPPFTRGCLGELSREKLALSQISHRHAASRYHPSHISPRAPVAPRPLRLRPPRAAAHTDSVLFHFLSSYFLSTASAVLRAGVGYGYGVERCHPGPGRSSPPATRKGAVQEVATIVATCDGPPVPLACRRSVSWPLPSLTWTPPTGLVHLRWKRKDQCRLLLWRADLNDPFSSLSPASSVSESVTAFAGMSNKDDEDAHMRAV